jgi:threonine synthase
VGATSGDTGSAAIDAVAGRDNIDIFMLHPKGRVSDVQRRQMTTVKAPNVYNIAIDGSFDDAQAIVKRMFGDPAMTDRFHISAVNSINWARLMAQVVYYFAAALQLGAPHRKVAFSVPTGNFGDVFAGYVAAQMGLPVERLIVATNVNDILHRALSAGDYSAGTVTPTAAPSMDIQVSSNFERLLFDCGGRDGLALAGQMRGFEASKAMRLTNAQSEGAAALLSSCRADATEMALAMAWARRECGELVDPHTAIALHAARIAELPREVPVVTLATAASGQVPRRRRARHRQPPVAADSGRRPVRPRGALRRAARHLRGDRGLRRGARDSVRLMAGLALEPLVMQGAGWADYGLVDSGHGRSSSATARSASFARKHRRYGSPRLADWPARRRVRPRLGRGRRGPLAVRSRRPPKAGRSPGARSRFTAQCTPFRHLGFFPDMAPVVGMGCASKLAGKSAAQALNLFGYTGVGTLALSECGPVTHVDASKKSVAQARENSALSNMADRPIRWLVDDAAKFVAREVRRGRRYDGIILDPPKFGRGPEGEVWRLEDGTAAADRRLPPAARCDSRFLFLTVYAVRMSSLALAGLLDEHLADLPGTIEHGDLAVREEGERRPPSADRDLRAVAPRLTALRARAAPQGDRAPGTSPCRSGPRARARCRARAGSRTARRNRRAGRRRSRSRTRRGWLPAAGSVCGRPHCASAAAGRVRSGRDPTASARRPLRLRSLASARDSHSTTTSAARSRRKPFGETRRRHDRVARCERSRSVVEVDDHRGWLSEQARRRSARPVASARREQRGLGALACRQRARGRS